MMDVTIKTLDGQNRNYSLPENMTVREFKERIVDSINMPADTQRLIFHGRVMQDDKMLKDYDVHGKVIHVVQRAPPTNRPPTTAASTASSGAAGTSDVNNVVVGSFTLPSDILDPNQVQNIVQQAISGLGDNWRNASVSTRASTDGSSVDVHINLGQIPAQTMDNEAQLRINMARQMLRQARETVIRLENPPGSGNADQAGENEATTEGPTPMETGESTTNQSEASSSSEEPSELNARSVGTDTGSAGNRQTGPNRPGIDAMADLLDEIREVDRRLQPFVEQMRDLTREDPELSGDSVQQSQRVCNLVCETLHAISHCYHSLSDIMIDMSTSPPRHLHAAPVAPVLPVFAPHGLPVRAQVNIGSPHPRQGTAVSQSATTTTTTSSATSETLTTSSSGPRSTSTTTTQSTVASHPAPGSGVPNLPSGFHAESSTNPYVFVEVRPDSVTVNSISAHVVSSENVNGTTPARPTDATGTRTSNTTSTSATTSQPSAPPPPTSQPGPPGAPGAPGAPGFQGIPGLPQDMVQNIIQSVLQSHGHRPGQPVHVNVVPIPVPASLAGSLPTAVSVSRITNSSTPATSVSQQTASATAAPTTATSTVPSTSQESTTATSQTTTTSQGTTAWGPTGSRPPGPIFVSAEPPAGVMSAGQRAVDPFLPCNSRHFLAQRSRSSAPQMNQNPETSLADMVSSLMTGLLGQPGPQMAGAPRPSGTSTTTTESNRTAPGGRTSEASRPTQTSTEASRSSQATTQTTTTTTQQGPLPANIFASLLSGTFGGFPPTAAPPASGPIRGFPFPQALRDILQTASQNSGQTSGSQGQGSTAMSDEAFTQLVQGIGTYMSQAALGRESSDTVANFLGTLEESYNVVSGEGFLNDVFQCLARHLTFADLFSVFFGHPEPLNRLCTPLQQFVRERVLSGEQFTPNNIRQGVDQLIEEMESEIDAAVSSVEVKPNINLTTTLKNLFRVHLINILTFIMESNAGDNSFGQQLYDRVRRLLSEFVVLTPSCLVGGLPAFETMLHSRLRHMTAGMNPLIQQWMVSMTSQQVQNFVRNVTMSDSEVNHHIVRTTEQHAQDTVRTNRQTELPMEMSPPSPPRSAAPHKKPPSAEKPRLRSTGTTSTLDKGKRPLVNGATSDGASPSHSASPTSPIQDDDVSWQSVVPSDWVPIINGDVKRQSENQIQQPMSDAYLQGMPAKRRKMMTQDRPPNSLTNMAEYVPDSLKRAAEAVGVQPISSQENFSSEAAEDTDLHSALEDEVQRILSHRLRNDSDYTSDQFPSAEKYYHKSDK